MIFSLAKNLLNQSYCIYVDNQYTSLEFCANLCSVNTDVIDTLRKDRKDLPEEVAGEKHKPSERKLQCEKNVGMLCFE